MGFSFSVNVYVFIPMVLLIIKNCQKRDFISVNEYVFIPIVLFYSYSGFY